MKKRIYSLLALTFVLVLLVGLLAGCAKKTANTSTSTNQVAVQSSLVTKEKGVLTVGFCASFPPFESRKPDGTFEGFDVDLANALANNMGLTVQFKDAEWQGLVPGLEKGDFDVLITCMAATEARGEAVLFTKPYYRMGSVIVVRSDTDTINSQADLAGKVVGVQLGTADEMAAEKIPGIKELRRFNNPPEVFLDIKDKRLDAAVVGYPYALNLVKQDAGFKVIGEQFDPLDIVAVVQKNNTQLQNALNQSLDNITNNGTYDGLVKKWLTL